MKNILLASTALVAFAGAASADVSLSGAAKLGFNTEYKDGVYTDLDLDFTFSQELDNGWTAKATYGFELAEGLASDGHNDGDEVTDTNLLLSLTSDFGGIYYGDTEFAAKTYWSGVSNMNEDAFSEQDGETVLRAEGVFGGFKGGVSVIPSSTAGGDAEQLSVGVSGTVGTVTVLASYQEESTLVAGTTAGDDFKPNEVFGFAASTTIGGADVKFAYAKDADDASTGIQATYPVGDVSLKAFYVLEDAIDDSYGLEAAYSANGLTAKVFFHDGGDEDHGIELGYTVSDVLSVYAGYSDDDGQYVGAEYDLGSSASLLVSYADKDGTPEDEIGPKEYDQGLTVELSLKF